MSEEKTLYESESYRTVPEVIEFFRQLAHWLEDRRIIFPHGEEEIVIEIPDEVVLEIELEEEDAGVNRIERSLEIEIEWTEDTSAEDAAGGVGGDDEEAVVETDQEA
ncbi:MAG: amphi-Trp domain-containing protein [Candidatus Promineifilaceae bacterium]|nr:amphi-Trp domain-containing protein [Candidatus Promineifilaceae bacterium]